MKLLSRIQIFPLRLISLFALLAGVFLLLLNLYLWWRFHVHLPMHDTAHLLPLVQNAVQHGFSSIALDDWFAIHAGAHRIAVTRLLMVIDYRYFSGSNHVIFASIWLSMLAMLMLYVAAFRCSYATANTLLIFVVGLLLVFLSSPSQFWNSINPINSSWYVVFAASALAIWLVARVPGLAPLQHLAAVYILAMVAAFSNFAGVLVWLLLPVLIAIRSRRAGMLTALLSGVFVWLYIRGVSFDFGLSKDVAEAYQLNTVLESPESLADLFQRGVTFAVRAGQYLGSPLSIEYPQSANMLVLFSLLPIAAGWIILLIRRLRGSDHHNLWFELTLSMATLGLGVALATQMGREFLWQPTAERYQNVVMMYWLNVCGLLLFFALQASNRTVAWQCSATILCAAIAAMLLTPTSDSVNRAVRDAGRVNETAVLGELGISDKWLNRRILNHESRDYFSDFRAFFAHYNVTYMAAKSHRIDAGTPRQCGQVKLQAEPSKWPVIYKLSGTIDDYSSKWYRRIPVTTEGGEIIGAVFPVYHHKLTFTHLLLQRDSRWEGYVRGPKNLDRAVYLHYRSPLFEKLSCRITLLPS